MEGASPSEEAAERLAPLAHDATTTSSTSQQQDRRELGQARLANLRLRSRLASQVAEQKRLEERQSSLDAELRRLRAELIAIHELLERERAARRRAEEQLDQAPDVDLIAAGWRVERERRTRAEAELARLRAEMQRQAQAVSSGLERLEALVRGWQEADEEDSEAPVSEHSGSEPSPLQSATWTPRSAEVSATPAGLLLARALELATGEVASGAAAQQLVAMADGDAGALEEAIARAERFMWEPTVEDMGSGYPETASEAEGQMAVLVAGASTLLSAALHRMRAR